MMEDLERVMFTKEQLANKIQAMGRIISQDYEGKDLVVVGILKGAAIFTMDLVRAITCPARLDLHFIKKYFVYLHRSREIVSKKSITDRF